MPDRQIPSICLKTAEEIIGILAGHLKETHARGLPITIELSTQEVALDPWEIDCIRGRDATSQTIARSVALRVLAEDLRRAFQERDSYSSTDVGKLLARIPEAAKESFAITPDLHRGQETADGPLQKKYRLTERKMANSVGTLLTAFEEAGFPVPTRDSARKPQRTGARRTAETRRDPGTEAAPAQGPSQKGKKLLVLGILASVLAVLVVLAVRQRGVQPIDLDPGLVGDLVPLENLWLRGETAGGILESRWFGIPETEKKSSALKASQLLAQSYPVKKLLLYQPGGQLLAAVVVQDKVTLFPPLLSR